MSIRLRLLVLMAVSLSALAQIALKYGMAKPQVQKALASLQYTEIAWAIGTNPGVICGLVIYAGSMMLWLLVLAQLDVSQAYPFVGIGFALTTILGYFLFGESMNIYRIAGTIVVGIGIMLLSH